MYDFKKLLNSKPEWLVLEEIILSGQMPDSDLQERLRKDPEFAAWLQVRAEKRKAGR
jgi:hypothetical protein